MVKSLNEIYVCIRKEKCPHMIPQENTFGSVAKNYRMPVSVVTTEPSTLEGLVTGAEPSPTLSREIRELLTVKE